MADIDFDGEDAQDAAETFDETHREDEDSLVTGAGESFDPDDPDLDERAYDVTSALGDDDDDDEEDDEDDLDEDDLGDDEEDDEDAEARYQPADRPDNDPDYREDQPLAARTSGDEPGLEMVGDVDPVTGPHNRDAARYESRGPLSDEQIGQLGYGKVEPEARAIPERGPERGQVAANVKIETSTQDERLEEGLDETFPASDPVSAHHIT